VPISIENTTKEKIENDKKNLFRCLTAFGVAKETS
jgi:hypothetical protein